MAQDEVELGENQDGVGEVGHVVKPQRQKVWHSSFLYILS